MDILNWIKAVVDILIVAFLLYKLIVVVQGTKAVQILRGTSVVLGVWFISGTLGLKSLQFISSQLIVYGILGILIIFQPELRSALERLGRQSFFNRLNDKPNELEEKIIKDIVESVEYMSKRRIGALMSIELDESLEDYIKTGILLDAHISKELIENIFTPNVPLHDGAVIIKGGKIASASCYLPLSEDKYIDKELGTRHRAAIGLSEKTDALTIVVSEETGKISITKGSKLYRGISSYDLKTHLELVLKKDDKKSNTPSNWFKGKGR